MRSVPGAVATGLLFLANSTLAGIETPSLSLPVLTSFPKLTPAGFVKSCKLCRKQPAYSLPM